MVFYQDGELIGSMQPGEALPGHIFGQVVCSPNSLWHSSGLLCGQGLEQGKGLDAQQAEPTGDQLLALSS